jgi:hypothetical protein
MITVFDMIDYIAKDNAYNEKAEECLSYFSIQNQERKRKQADIYSKTGRIKEAYKTLEELLFSDYGMVSMVFHKLDFKSRENTETPAILSYFLI